MAGTAERYHFFRGPSAHEYGAHNCKRSNWRDKRDRDADGIFTAAFSG
jgi:hypothetical protein